MTLMGKTDFTRILAFCVTMDLTPIGHWGREHLLLSFGLLEFRHLDCYCCIETERN